MDQVFAVRQMCEEYLANGNTIDGNTIDRHGMWPMLRVLELEENC